MKIRHIQIHNYRSIHDLEFNTLDWVVFLGPNNHGKSNLLCAVEFFLSSNMKPSKDDLFQFHEEGDNELWVDIRFEDLSEQENETFIKYIRGDGTLKIRKIARFDPSSDDIDVGYHGYLKEPKQWWLKNSAFEQLRSREKIEAEAIKIPLLKGLLEQEGRITLQQLEKFQNDYIESHPNEIVLEENLEKSSLLGRNTIANGVLPDFHLIPAVRDLGDETKVKNTTLFGRLIQSAIVAMSETDGRFIELQERLELLVTELNQRGDDAKGSKKNLAQLERDLSQELKAWGVNVSIQLETPEMGKLFELGTQLHIDDGHRSLAERKGHGLQRAVIFALLRTWAKALRSKQEDNLTTPRKTSEAAVFVIEEPELFLHPHAQRQLARDLLDISETPGNQVFICSHSTHFVNLDQYQSIVIVRKDNARKGTKVRQCSRDLFEGEDAESKKHRFHMASWVNPDRGELFFARKVILVEGETEQTLFPFIANKLGCFDPSVTIVDCASKHNLLLYIRILNAFEIKYVVVHDEDPLPDPLPNDWDDAANSGEINSFELNTRIAEEVNRDLGSIFVLSPDFEIASGIRKIKRKNKAIVALDHFYLMPKESIPGNIQEIVTALYCKD
jgi:putative ATP-dependent endonuclease of OLD family